MIIDEEGASSSMGATPAERGFFKGAIQEVLTGMGVDDPELKPKDPALMAVEAFQEAGVKAKQRRGSTGRARRGSDGAVKTSPSPPKSRSGSPKKGKTARAGDSMGSDATASLGTATASTGSNKSK